MFNAPKFKRKDGAGADNKPAPDKSKFSKDQISADTEAEMSGRPQKHGAAMQDDDVELDDSDISGLAPKQNDMAQPDASAPPADKGGPEAADPQSGDPDTASMPEGSPVDGANPADAGQPSPEEQIAQLSAKNDELESRLAAVEEQVSGSNPRDKKPQVEPEMLHDDDEYSGGY